MVLKRALFAILCLVAACKGQSLFDNHVGGGGDDDSTGDGGNGSADTGIIASNCPAGCIGDAAADIGGGRDGWRYLEDSRNRMWTPMTAAGDGYVGAVSPNAIETCGANGSLPGCVSLPGALLVTTAGATSGADPALEFTVDAAKVVTLTVKAYVPMGQTEQRIRLYRNSREDSLITAAAMPGEILDKSITVDALAGDRFLVSVAPAAMGASQVALHFYINDTGAVFPSQCQLAVGFEAATGNTVANACGPVFTFRDYDLSSPDDIPPVLTAGPFPEQGMAADLQLTEYYNTTATISRTGDSTTQFWVKHEAFDSGYSAFPFSDVDIDRPGGIQIYIYEGSSPKMLGIGTFTAPFPNQVPAYQEVIYPNDTNWHFVRISHNMGTVSMCIDGVKLGELAVAPGGLATNVKPKFGIVGNLSPSGAFFDGAIDDVRAFSTALPCE